MGNIKDITIGDPAVRWPGQGKGQVLEHILKEEFTEFVERARIFLSTFTVCTHYLVRIPDNPHHRFSLDVEVNIRGQVPPHKNAYKPSSVMMDEWVKFNLVYPINPRSLKSVKFATLKSLEFMADYGILRDFFLRLPKIPNINNATPDHPFGAAGKEQKLKSRLGQLMKADLATTNARLRQEALELFQSDEFEEHALSVIKEELRAGIQEMTSLLRPVVPPDVLHELIDESYVKDMMDE